MQLTHPPPPPSAAYMHQCIRSAQTNAPLLSLEAIWRNFSEIMIKIQTFPSLNCIWKYRLRNDDHISSVCVCVGGWWVNGGWGWGWGGVKSSRHTFPTTSIVWQPVAMTCRFFDVNQIWHTYNLVVPSVHTLRLSSGTFSKPYSKFNTNTHYVLQYVDGGHDWHILDFLPVVLLRHRRWHWPFFHI